jgi:hypothetical protein
MCQASASAREKRAGDPQTLAQQVPGALALAPVFFVDQLAVPAAHRDALHGHAPALQREDFPADEAVAHLRILVDEVGDAQGHRLTCIR